MITQEVLEQVARGMVTAGLYKDMAAAIRAMALEQIERKLATYRAQVEGFEQQYHHNLETHSALLAGHASMAEEDEWMEWKGAVVMPGTGRYRKCSTMSVKLDIEQVKAILTASALVTSWHILLADETVDRALYKLRCQLLPQS